MAWGVLLFGLEEYINVGQQRLALHFGPATACQETWWKRVADIYVSDRWRGAPDLEDLGVGECLAEDVLVELLAYACDTGGFVVSMAPDVARCGILELEESAG